MAKELRHNDKGWGKLNDSLGLIDTINKQGYVDVTTAQIKSIAAREPRLMAKFDHRSSLPTLFEKEGVNILPINRQTYRLLRFNAYAPIEYGNDYCGFNCAALNRYDTLDINSINSEDKLILVSWLSGVLGHFLGEEHLAMTIKGKFGTDRLEFCVGNQPIVVTGAGAELDAGFEGRDVYLLEAKLGKVDDFHIRQLYFPYLYWRNIKQLSKTVHPIFITYYDGKISLHKFAFENLTDFGSIYRVNFANYALNFKKIDVDDVFSHIHETQLLHPPQGIPFPQADDIEKIITVGELAYARLLSNKLELVERFSFVPRQADYYYNAARYIGLLNDDLTPTDLLTDLMQVEPNKRRYKIIRHILSLAPIHQAFADCQRSGFTREVIAESLRRNVPGISGTTIGRRATTVFAWFNWFRSQ